MYVLVVVEDLSANADRNRRAALKQFLADTSKDLSETNGNASVLREGVYQLSLDHGLETLGSLVSKASEAGFSLRTLFFDQEPSWIVSKVEP